MLWSLRLSALPKKLYDAQLKVRAEVGDVLLGIPGMFLFGEPVCMTKQTYEPLMKYVKGCT